ncbi:MAG: FkbM family methyltransferase [Burkholderiaceae bacterium]
MDTTRSSSLRARLLQAFASDDAPALAHALRDRRIVIFGPQSTLGLAHLRHLVDTGANIVLAVDDYCKSPQLHGVPVVGSAAFVAGAARVAGAVLADFSMQPYGQALCRLLGASAGLDVIDALPLLGAYDAASVYETRPDYRSRTRARADDWLALADRLADDFSRETLYALLLQRLEYDRGFVAPVNIGGRDEYFGQPGSSATFVMGSREHFVDCGAHRGTIVQKLLGCTGGAYASIQAFEPDAASHAALQWLTPVPLRDFHAHRCAVGERSETLRFAETGTMGSHVSAAGNVEVRAVALDDCLDRATFIKMDVEGFEAKALRGAARLLREERPRLAVASYHYAHDLLEIAGTIDTLAPGYTLRLRHHISYFYDSILYASPREDWLPVERAV